MKEKFIRKWMKQAKALAEDEIPCLSRGIGVVIVNPETNNLVATGYNGEASGLPDADSYKHLSEYVYPQLTVSDKEYISKNLGCIAETAELFANKFQGCEICPRRLVGAKSGARLELCDCAHAERNAIHNAAKAGHSTYKCVMLMWCGLPCIECTNSIINSGISEIYCLDQNRDEGNNEYGFWRSQWKLDHAGVKVNRISKEWILL